MTKRENDFQSTMRQIESCMSKQVSKNQVGNNYIYTKNDRKIKIMFVDKNFNDKSYKPKITKDLITKEYVVLIDRKNGKDSASIKGLIKKGLGD